MSGVGESKALRVNINIFTGQPGIQLPLPRNATPTDVISLFLPDDILNTVVQETNR